MASKPIPMFYKPTSPPPPLPLLTCQTDFSYIPIHPLTITVCEEPLPRSSTTQHGQHKPRATGHASFSPYVKPLAKVKFAPSAWPTPSTLSDKDGESECGSKLTDLSEDSSKSSLSDDGVVSKPEGEVSRPRSGGYNLGDTLVARGRDLKTFKELQKSVHRLVDEQLDTTQSYQHQNENLCQRICDTATTTFPQLMHYESCWPVNDLMILHLKNTSRREKLRMEKLELVNTSKKGKA